MCIHYSIAININICYINYLVYYLFIHIMHCVFRSLCSVHSLDGGNIVVISHCAADHQLLLSLFIHTQHEDFSAA